MLNKYSLNECLKVSSRWNGLSSLILTPWLPSLDLYHLACLKAMVLSQRHPGSEGSATLFQGLSLFASKSYPVPLTANPCPPITACVHFTPFSTLIYTLGSPADCSPGFWLLVAIELGQQEASTGNWRVEERVGSLSLLILCFCTLLAHPASYSPRSISP